MKVFFFTCVRTSTTMCKYGFSFFDPPPHPLPHNIHIDVTHRGV